MSKRTPDLPRHERDFYATPEAAVLPLLPHLAPGTRFYEPCAGDGALIDHLTKHGMVCVGASDIHPLRHDISEKAVLALRPRDLRGADCVIVNTPWPAKHGHGEPTLGMIHHLSCLRPSWFLLPGDFAHNVYAAPSLDWCSDIVSIGRVKWIAGTEHTGKDNCCWMRFDRRKPTRVTAFHARRTPNGLEDLL